MGRNFIVYDENVKEWDVQGVLTLSCGGVDRVVELKEQLGIEEVDGEGQEGKVKEEGRDRVKEKAPWMTMNVRRT